MKKTLISLLSIAAFGVAYFINGKQFTCVHALSENVSLSDGVIVDISAGTDHNLALDQDGNLWAWGRNDYGQLGNGTTTNSNVPIQILRGNKFKYISAGDNMSAAIDLDGVLWAWGCDKNPAGIESTVPVKVSESTSYYSVNCSSGYYFLNETQNRSIKEHFGFVSETNTGQSWYSQSLHYLSEWMENSAPSISNDSYSYYYASPGSRTRVYYSSTYGSATNYATSIVTNNSGNYSNQIISADGVVFINYNGVNRGGDAYNWGYDYNLTIIASYGFVFSDGTALFIPNNNQFPSVDGALFSGSYIDCSITNTTENSLSTAFFVTCDGKIEAVGNNSLPYNLLGSSSTISTNFSTSKVVIDSLSGVKKVSAGKNHVIAIDSDGKVYSWGSNEYGQLGIGSFENKVSPTKIRTFDEKKSFRFVAFGNEMFDGNFTQFGGNNYTLLETPNKGSLLINSSNGEFTYTPNTDAMGEDLASISINYSSSKVVYDVNIYIDNKPVFTGGTPSLNVECGQSVNGTAPSTDQDGDNLVYFIYQQPTKGTVVLNNNSGSFTYTARSDVAGGDSFVLAVSDGYCSVQYPVSVHVHSLISFSDETEIQIDLNNTTTYSSNVNAIDIDGDILSYSVLTNGSKGNVTIDEDGNYVYTANGSFFGEDTFVLRVNDGYMPLDINYTVHLFAVSDNGTALVNKITKGTIFNGEIKTNAKGTTPVYSVYQQALNGQVEINEDSGEYTYTPNLESVGDDYFVVLVNYGYGQYTVTIHVYQNTVPDASTVTVNLNTNQNVNYVGMAQCVDVDGDILSYSVNTQPLKGSLSLNQTTGEFTYYPNPNVAGNDSFKIDVNDGTDIITISFNMHIESEINIQSNIYETISQNTSLSGNVNASDLDGDALVYSINNGAMHGVANVDSLTGSFIYVPFTNFYGDDSFSIIVDDGVSAKICTIHVTVNRKPIADQITINLTTQGVTATGTAHCSDPDGDVLIYSIIEEPTKGSAIVDSNNGSFAYTPFLDAAGNDSFKIKATDGVDDIIITINIHNETDVKLAEQTTSIVVNQGKSTTGQVYAIDLDGDDLVYSIVTYPTQGTVNLNTATGAWTFNAKTNAAGTDSFSIKVTDGQSEVIINYELVVNTPASFEESSYSIITNQNSNYSGQVSAVDADGDTLVFSIVSQGQKGTVTIDPSTGRYLYVPNENEAGNDSFVIGVSDGNFTTEVEINVHIETGVTVASSTIAHETEKNGVVIGNVNASDSDGDSLTYAIYQQGSKGSATIMGDGSYSYFANNGAGDDNFVVSISDGIHTVYVTVYVHINSDPYFEESAISVSVPQNGNTTGRVHGFDEDGDALSYSVSTQPMHGSVNLNSITGEFTYITFSNSTASSDSFVVAVTDGNKTSYVTVSVIINNAPEVNDVSISVSQGGNGGGKLTASDPENDTLTYSITSQGGHGTANINSSTGEFTYTTTDRNFSGTDSFTVSVSDGYTTKYIVVKVEVIKNTKPTSSGTAIELNSGSSASGKLNVTDPENDTLTYSIVSQGDKGTAYIDEKTGEFTYSANKDTSGYDCFVVNVSDGFNTTSFLVEVHINFVDSYNSWAIPTTIATGSAAVLSIGGLAFILLRFRKKIFIK